MYSLANSLHPGLAELEIRARHEELLREAEQTRLCRLARASAPPAYTPLAAPVPSFSLRRLLLAVAHLVHRTRPALAPTRTDALTLKVQLPAMWAGSAPGTARLWSRRQRGQLAQGA